VLKSKNLLVPAPDPKHIFIVSNDGIPQECDAIRKGEIDATVSQPADLHDPSLWRNQIGK
jgi:ribose transport system substrate-binding protein